jgi:putative heme iron utilization protein
VIVRDHAAGSRDGVNENGEFYAFEAIDRGEVFVRRRENDRCIDVSPKTRSQAVRQGYGINELKVMALGQQLIFLVNGSRVASVLDPLLGPGTVGVIVDSDSNDVLLERFPVEMPN